MTETMAESTLGVGSTITSRQQLVDLPVGSVISGRRGNETKIGVETWSRGPGHSRRTDEFRPDTYTYRVVSIGDPLPAVGSVVTTEQFTSLPEGTIIRRGRAGATGTWTRTATGWHSSGGTFRTPENMRRDVEYRVEAHPHVGEPVDTTIETPLPGTEAGDATGETLEDFKARFRTIVYGSQNAAGVNRTPVTRALQKLGVETHPRIVPGLPVIQWDSRLIQEFPMGTVATYGDDPTKFGEYALFAKTHDGLVKLLGGASPDSYALLRVVKVPGVEAPEPVASSESEHRDIQAFMRQAWEVGVEAKASNSWCGEYERAMQRCGIDGSSLHSIDSGHTAEEVAAMPEGTYLRVCVSINETVIYVRDDTADNPAKTRRLGGALPGSWAQRGMVVVGTPGQNMSIPVLSAAEMDGMPLGTVISEMTSRWTKQVVPAGETRDWFTDGGYHYRSNQFGISNALRYVVIPR